MTPYALLIIKYYWLVKHLPGTDLGNVVESISDPITEKKRRWPDAS